MTAFPLRTPSAWLPILMSLAALSLVLGHIAVHGIGRQDDEGTAAHVFQLLMAGQVPMIAWFAIRWLPEFPRKAGLVLVLQALAGLAAILAVVWLESRPA